MHVLSKSKHGVHRVSVRRELKIMQLVTHPHVVRLYEITETPSQSQTYLWSWSTLNPETCLTSSRLMAVCMKMMHATLFKQIIASASPMTDFERANLISWARLLAQSGNVLDVVDSNQQLV